MGMGDNIDYLHHKNLRKGGITTVVKGGLSPACFREMISSDSVKM